MGKGYQRFGTYSWADTATLLNLYLTCVHPRVDSVGSLHLQEHLYARVSPKVRM